MEEIHISDLAGVTLRAANLPGLHEREEVLFILTSDEHEYLFYHMQDCCEMVDFEELGGEIAFLIDVPIIEGTKIRRVASEAERQTDHLEEELTTYTLSTRKGKVDFRFTGLHNGHYSVNVWIGKIPRREGYITF